MKHFASDLFFDFMHCGVIFMHARPPTSKPPNLKSYGSLPSAPLAGERARESGRKRGKEGGGKVGERRAAIQGREEDTGRQWRAPVARLDDRKG